MAARRTAKKPVSPPKKKDDDWLSPLIGAAGTVAGAALGGPVGAMIGGAIGGAAGKTAASAAGMGETGVTKALNTATSIGEGLAGRAGLTGTDAVAAQLGLTQPEPPAMPAMAQAGVQTGQDMVARQVANEGLQGSPVARNPISQTVYDVMGTNAPANMQALPPQREAATGALGYVPNQGLVYEATPEAANRRRQEALMGMVQARESQLMGNQPLYADLRYASEVDRFAVDAAAQQAAAEAELSEYRRRFGVLEGEMAADEAIEERKRRAQSVPFPNALANPEFPLYRQKR